MQVMGLISLTPPDLAAGLPPRVLAITGGKLSKLKEQHSNLPLISGCADKDLVACHLSIMGLDHMTCFFLQSCLC